MYSTVKIGKRIINLSNVTEIIQSGPQQVKILFNVAGQEGCNLGRAYALLYNEEAIAFMAYMNSHSRDVMAEYEASKRVQERISARQDVVDTDMIKPYNEA